MRPRRVSCEVDMFVSRRTFVCVTVGKAVKSAMA